MSASVHRLESRQSSPFDERLDIVTDYAAGNLSPAKHALMSCAVELNEDLAVTASFQTDVAASLIQDIRPVPLSPLLIGETLAKLTYKTKGEIPPLAANDPEAGEPRHAPKPLRDLMGGTGLRDITWKSLVPGVAVHDVLGNRRTKNGDRLYLLRAKGGMRMPEHSHTGEEWTLILDGAYSSNGKTYRRGDIHIEDETETHAPEILEGGDCICLVMAQGPVVMKNWIPKIVQQVVGI